MILTDKRLERYKNVLQDRQLDLTVICENIHDSHNVSAILRSCDAVGIFTVHLLYTKEAFPQLDKKSSASAKKWITFKRFTDYEKLRERLKAKKMTIYATYIDPSAKSIYEVDWTKPSAILVGNEHRGVSDECLKIADHAIFIPMFGMVESLNVSVATAVILYEACRQRISQQRYPTEKDSKWMNKTLQNWTQKK